MKTRSLRAFVVFTALCCAPGFALAQSKAKPQAAQPAESQSARKLADVLTGEAKTAYDLAVVQYRNGQFANAASNFKKAYDLSGDSRLLWNESAAERQLSNYVRASELVRQYLAKTPNLSADDKAEAEKLLSAMAPLIAQLSISVNQPGAQIIVRPLQGGTAGDAIQVQSPLSAPLSLDVGHYVVEVSKPNYQRFQTELALVSGAKSKLNVNLMLHITDAGLVVSTNRSDAELRLNGGPLGTGSFSGRVGPGSYELSVSSKGYKPYSTQFALRAKDLRKVDVTLEKEREKVPVWVIVAGSLLAAGAIGIGSYAAISAALKPDVGDIRGGTFPPSLVRLRGAEGIPLGAR